MKVSSALHFRFQHRLRRPGPHGFTLVELLVGLAVLTLLLVMGAPSFGTWMQNTRIRGTAESIVDGLQFAKSEAVTRNARVRFQLTSTLGADCAASNAGVNWVVNLDPDADPDAIAGACDAAPSETDAPFVLQARPAAEGSGTSVVSASQATVAFNGLGRPVPTPAGDITIDVSNPGGGECAADGGPMACLRVLVSPGGQIRMCNPRFAATDPQGCPS